MGFIEQKHPEPALYETDSGPRQGQVMNLGDIVTIPSRWKKVHVWSEKLGAETIGCQQLQEEARDVNQKPRSKLALLKAGATAADIIILGTFFVWSTANFHYSSFTTGALGPILFGLGWWDSFATIVIFNFIGDIAPSIISYLGPRLGMRSMIITRYSFGYWASKLIVLLNAITCIGVSISPVGPLLLLTN